MSSVWATIKCTNTLFYAIIYEMSTQAFISLLLSTCTVLQANVYNRGVHRWVLNKFKQIQNDLFSKTE